MYQTVCLVQVKYSHLSHTSRMTETVCLVQTSTGYGPSVHASILIANVKKGYWILLKPSRTPLILIQPGHPCLMLHIPAAHAYSSYTHPMSSPHAYIISTMVTIDYNVKIRDIVVEGHWTTWSHEMKFSFLEAGLTQYLDGNNAPVESDRVSTHAQWNA